MNHTDGLSLALTLPELMSARARAQLIKRWHALIVANTDDLARLISREQGKPTCTPNTCAWEACSSTIKHALI